MLQSAGFNRRIWLAQMRSDERRTARNAPERDLVARSKATALPAAKRRFLEFLFDVLKEIRRLTIAMSLLSLRQYDFVLTRYILVRNLL